MPQTTPIDKRALLLTKLLGRSQKDNSKAGKDAARLARQQDRELDRKRRAEVKHERMLTGEQGKRFKVERNERRRMAQERAGTGGGGRGGMGMRMPAMKAIPGMVAGAAMGTLVGIITSQVSAAIDEFARTVKGQRDVAGMINTTTLDKMVGEGAGRGFDVQESMQHIRGVGRAVGLNKPDQFPTEALKLIQEAQTNMGIGSEETIGLMSGIRQAGVKGGKSNMREVQRIWADGVASGLEKTRLPEHMQNVSKGMQMVGDSVAGTVDIKSISETLKNLGGLGAGFQGARGANVMSAFSATLKSAATMSAPDDIQAFMLRHVGKYGGPGMSNNIGEALKQMDLGFNKENVRNMVSGAVRETGGGQGAALQLMKLTKGQISYTKSDRLVKWAEGGFKDTEGSRKLLRETEQDAEPVDKQMLVLAKEQAKIQVQQWRNGKELYVEVLAIKTAINQFVTMIIPAVKELLILVRQFVEDFSIGFKIIVDQFGGGKEAVDEGSLTASGRQRLKEFRDATSSGASVGKLQAMKAAQDQETSRLSDFSGRSGGFTSSREQAAARDASIQAAEEMKKTIDETRMRTKKETSALLAQESAKLDIEARQKKTTDNAILKIAEDGEATRKSVEGVLKNTTDDKTNKAAAAKTAIEAGAPASDVVLEPAF